MTPIKTILYATDLDGPHEPAFQLASSVARDQGADLVVLHVYPPPCCHGDVVARRQPDDYQESLWQLLRGYDARGLEGRVRHRLEEGEPARTILRVAGEVTADLIVVGTHGRSGLPRLLLGSVAEQVVRGASCPVLALKAPRAPAEPALAGDTRRQEVPSAEGGGVRPS